MKDKNTFSNMTLGISIRKPDDWVFIPAQWALKLLISRVEPFQEGDDQLIKYAQEPVFYFHYDHGYTDQVLPTVCGMYRIMPGIGSIDRATFLRMQIIQLQAVFDDFAVIEASVDGVVSRKPANIIRSAFTVYSSEGNELECLSRCYLIFAGDRIFSIEMSGPTGGEFCCEEEFNEILLSIRID